MIERRHEVRVKTRSGHHHQPFAVGLELDLPAKSPQISRCLLRVAPRAAGQTGIAQGHRTAVPRFEKLFVKIPACPIAAQDMRDLVRQDRGPKTAAGVGDSCQPVLHVDRSIGRGVRIDPIVFNDADLPAHPFPCLCRDLLHQTIEHQAGRRVASGGRDALRHKLRPQLGCGFLIEREVRGHVLTGRGQLAEYCRRA